jgi:hypothetical protein
MDIVELAQRALQECFARSLSSDIDEGVERQDRKLAASLRKMQNHFGDASVIAQACNAPLAPYCPSLPLPLACHLFAGARGRDYPTPPESCKILLELGANPFVPSELPPTGRPLHGRFIFASETLNAFEIALARSDAGLILSLAPMMLPEHFQPQHWIAYELFCDFEEPLSSLCEQAMRSLAERGFLLSSIGQPSPSSLEEPATSGQGRKRL